MRQLNEYEAELVAGGLSESDSYGDGTYATYDGDGGWTIDGSSNLYGGWDGYYDLTGAQSGLYGGSGGGGSGSGGLPLTSETDTDGDGIMDDVDPDADGDGVKDDEIIVSDEPMTPEQQRQHDIAMGLAERFAMQDMLFYGAMFGLAVPDLAAALQSFGLTQTQALALAGGVAATGAPTSVSEMLADLRDDVTSAYYNRIIDDMNNNPENYDGYSLDPANGNVVENPIWPE